MSEVGLFRWRRYVPVDEGDLMPLVEQTGDEVSLRG